RSAHRGGHEVELPSVPSRPRGRALHRRRSVLPHVQGRARRIPPRGDPRGPAHQRQHGALDREEDRAADDPPGPQHPRREGEHPRPHVQGGLQGHPQHQGGRDDPRARGVRLRVLRPRSASRSRRDAPRIRHPPAFLGGAACSRRAGPRRRAPGLPRAPGRRLPGEDRPPGVPRAGEARARSRRVPPRRGARVASLAPAPGPSADIRCFAQPRSGRAKVRVGVFADRALQPRWLVEAIAKAAACDFVELAFVAIVPGLPRGVAEPASWRAYRTIDEWIFGSARDPSCMADLAVLVPADRRIAWTASAALPAVDVAFAAGAVDDAALDGLARYGTWRYCFGEAQGVLEPLAGVREVIDAAPVTASGIRIRRPGHGIDRIACGSWSRTVAFSLARTREGLLAKSADFLARTLRDVHAFGTPWLEQATAPAQPLAQTAYPRGAALAGGLARVAARVAQRALE